MLLGPRTYTDKSLDELYAFLAVVRAHSLWHQLPESVAVLVASYVREPMLACFRRLLPDDHAVLARILEDGRTLQAPFEHEDRVYLCGPAMDLYSGVYEFELDVLRLVSLDAFCRADLGIAVCPSGDQRMHSGLRWEAGDGDVFIDADLGGVGAGLPGWLGDEQRVETGVLPRWDFAGSRPGLVVDMYRMRLGFTLGGVSLAAEFPLPATRLHCVVSWAAGTAGVLRLCTCRRRMLSLHAPLGRLLQDTHRNDCPPEVLKQLLQAQSLLSSLEDLGLLLDMVITSGARIINQFPEQMLKQLGPTDGLKVSEAALSAVLHGLPLPSCRSRVAALLQVVASLQHTSAGPISDQATPLQVRLLLILAVVAISHATHKDAS